MQSVAGPGINLDWPVDISFDIMDLLDIYRTRLPEKHMTLPLDMKDPRGRTSIYLEEVLVAFGYEISGLMHAGSLSGYSTE